MDWRASASFAATPSSPGEGRAFCAQTLRTHVPAASAEVVADVEVIVSELLTNAVNARCSTAEVTLAGTPSLVRVGVVDDAEGAPVPQQPGDRDGHGRGLRIVAALASRWGCEPVGAGKHVWADLLVG